MKDVKRRLVDELDDRWRNKGHAHIKDKTYQPRVCPACKGSGVLGDFKDVCGICQGLGEIE